MEKQYMFYIEFPCNLISSGENVDEAFNNLQKQWYESVPELLRSDITMVKTNTRKSESEETQVEFNNKD